jgi:hypothetical protein
MVTLSLFKDLSACGYDALIQDFTSIINHFNNCQVIHHLLGLWGKSTIQLGDSDDWDDTVEEVEIPNGLEKL